MEPTIFLEKARSGKLTTLDIKKFTKDYDINITNENGQTALHLAAEAGHAHVVKILLTNRADPAALDKISGDTALHLACKHHQFEAINTLVQHTIDFDYFLTNREGKTPYMEYIAKRSSMLSAMSREPEWAAIFLFSFKAFEATRELFAKRMVEYGILINPGKTVIVDKDGGVTFFATDLTSPAGPRELGQEIENKLGENFELLLAPNIPSSYIKLSAFSKSGQAMTRQGADIATIKAALLNSIPFNAYRINSRESAFMKIISKSLEKGTNWQSELDIILARIAADSTIEKEFKQMMDIFKKDYQRMVAEMNKAEVPEQVSDNLTLR